MSNTPNPRRAPRVKTVRTVEMFKLVRNADGVILRNGVLPSADYERVRAARPELALPELSSIPLEA